MGGGVAKATESGLNTLRPLSLKVCQRVHGGRRPSKSIIMGFNAFHLRRERKACDCTCCVEWAQQYILIYGHHSGHKSAPKVKTGAEE